MFCGCTLNWMYNRNGNIGNWSLSEQTQTILKSKTASSQSLIIGLQVSHSANSESIKFIALLENFPRRSILFSLNVTWTFVNADIFSSPFHLPARVVSVNPPPPYLRALLGPLLSTLRPHRPCLRLTLNSAGRYSSGCVAASCVVSYGVETVGFKVPTTPWRDMNYSHASFHHPPNHPPTPLHNKLSWNYKYHQLCLSLSSESPWYAFNYWCQISSTSCPYVEFTGLKAREKRDASERHTHIHTRSHRSHTLSSSRIPLLLLSTVINTYSGWYTHTRKQRRVIFHFRFVPSPKCRLCWGCGKSGLSSVSKVWGRAIYPSSPPPSCSTSPAGGTLIYFMEYYFLSFSALPWHPL